MSLNGQGLWKLIDIFNKDPNERTTEDIQAAMQATEKFEFFAKMGIPDLHLQCCRFLRHSYKKAGEFVFKAGDIGKTFYLILSGRVEVRVVIQETGEGDGENEQTVANFSSGMTFGELALIQDGTRIASILCIDNCNFATLDKETYIKILGSYEERKLNDKIKFLRSLPAFSKMTTLDLAALSYFFEVQRYKKKDCAFWQGQESNSVIIVKSGQFKLSKRLIIEHQPDISLTTNGRKKVYTNKIRRPTILQVQLSVMGVGEIIGDEDVIKGSQRSFSCFCDSEEGEVMVISGIVKFIQNFNKKLKNRGPLKYLQRRNKLLNRLHKQREDFVVGLHKNKGNLSQRSPKNHSNSPSPVKEESPLSNRKFFNKRVQPNPINRQIVLNLSPISGVKRNIQQPARQQQKSPTFQSEAFKSNLYKAKSSRENIVKNIERSASTLNIRSFHKGRIQTDRSFDHNLQSEIMRSQDLIKSKRDVNLPKIYQSISLLGIPIGQRSIDRSIGGGV